MKREEFAKLRALSLPDLEEQARSTKEELFNLRFQKSTGALADLSRLRAVRRDYAVIQTLITQKQAAEHGTT